MKEETPASPWRLPPTPGAVGNRHTRPSKSTLLPSPVVPLSPLLSSSQKKPLSHDMPSVSAVLVASRSPPMSPNGSVRREDDTAALEAYALRIYKATKKKRKSSTAINVHVAMPTKPRRIVSVPTLSNNQRSKKKKKKQPNDNDHHRVNAGVYVVENRKTGHRFVGTTWDLHNAETQCFRDLEDGIHPHCALVSSFQTYGTASGIGFRVLERVGIPDATDATRYPHKKEPTFDVHAMETLLENRQRHHLRKIYRHCARDLVQRRLVRPWLVQYWALWTQHTLEMPREHEVFAAAVVVQSIVRMFLAGRRVAHCRRQRAAQRIAAFVALGAMYRVLRKRRERRRRHASATTIQQWVRRCLYRQRQAARALVVQQWLAARTLQRVYRGYCGRQAVQALRRANRREQRAIVMHAVARGFLVRRRVQHQRHAMWLDGKATIIQAWWRGRYVRQCVFLPRQQARTFQHRQETAACRLQMFHRMYFVRHKLTHAAKQHAHEIQQVTRIHAAYKNYLAKKFGWAATTYKLEQTSALRIQKAIRRWFFFARIARWVELERRNKAAQQLQRVYRGSQGRQIARTRRIWFTLNRAASRIQYVWRLSQALTKLHAAVDYWRRDTCARRIQARYRGYHGRCTFLVFRAEARRQRAAIRIQSTFRSHLARREWRRRLQLKRDGNVCQDCGDATASFYSWRFSMKLCATCMYRWHQHDRDVDDPSVVELGVYRRQQKLAILAQRVYRGFQVRTGLRFGNCAFCESRAVRIACRTCPGTRKFCHSCDVLFHAMAKPSKLHTDRIRIEEYIRQHEAAVVLQKHARRYAHRHTLPALRHRRQTVAVTKIQLVYVSKRQRRHTRALVAARQELAFRQQCGANLIQRRVRVFLAQRELNRLRTQHKSAKEIQRVFRGHRGRLEAIDLRIRRDAAVCIQRHVRGAQGRCQANARRVEVQIRREQAAATTLQRHSHGWLVRRRLWHRKRGMAALVIQSAWRRNRAKRVLIRLIHDWDERLRLEAEAREQERQARQREKERMATTRIQSCWRRQQAYRELQRLRLAFARQKRLEQLTIWLTVERKSAMRIQRFVRRKWLMRVARVSLVMQCSARQWLARRELSHLGVTKKAAVCIQRAFRYSRAKRKLTRLVSLEGMAVAGTVGGWVELFDEESGSVYYYNRETMASQWVKPPEMIGEAPDVALWHQQSHLGELEVNEPPEWVEYWDDNVGASYFYNTITGEATWATPDGVTSNQSEENLNEWAWPPGAPFDGKVKYGDQKEATANTNQTEVEGQEPASTEAYYVDENGNSYAYDYSAYYDYSSYVDPNGYSQYTASPAAGAYSMDPPNEGFDESPVDTRYDINYEIYMTQLQRDSEQQEQDGTQD